MAKSAMSAMRFVELLVSMTQAITRTGRARASIRILVVDDFEPWCQFVRTVLGVRPELEIMDQAHDGYTAIKKVEELQPDLILLDIFLPGLSGIETARRIRQIAPNSKIIFVTLCSAKEVADGALNAGAVGYVIKLNAGKELLVAIEAALQGRSFIGDGLCE